MKTPPLSLVLLLAFSAALMAQPIGEVGRPHDNSCSLCPPMGSRAPSTPTTPQMRAFASLLRHPKGPRGHAEARKGIERPLVVHTVFRDGRGAPGIPVCVRAARLRPQGTMPRMRDSKRTWQGRSNEGGALTIDLSTVFPDESWYPSWRAPLDWDRRVVWVGLDYPGAPAGIRIDLSTSSRGEARDPEPVKLVLAPSRSVEIEVENPAGLPSRELVWVEAWSEAAPWQRTRIPVPNGRRLLSLPRVAAEGAIWFRVVPAEQRLAPGRPTRLEAGAHELVLRHGGLRPALSGTLLDAEGRPVPAGSYLMRLAGNARNAPLLPFRCDDQGRFRVILKSIPKVLPLEIEIWPGTIPMRLQMTPPPTLKLRTRWDRSLEPGDNALGALRLLALPVIVGGRVVHADGRPARGVSVEVTLHPKGQRHPRLFEILSDAEGRFVMTHEALVGEVSVRARRHGKRSEAQSCAPGSKRILLRLPE